MKTYFIDNSPEAKVILWGDQSQSVDEAVPVVIFPPVVTDDLVNEVLKTILSNDSYAKEGEKVEEMITQALEGMSDTLDMDTLTKEILGE